MGRLWSLSMCVCVKLNCVSPTMDIVGLPNFSGSCHQRSTVNREIFVMREIFVRHRKNENRTHGNYSDSVKISSIQCMTKISPRKKIQHEKLSTQNFPHLRYIIFYYELLYFELSKPRVHVLCIYLS